MPEPPDATLARRGARVEVRSPLPAVLGHHQTLVQVLLNLLHNAVTFVTPGVAPTVRVYAQKNDGRVRLTVEDNGIGVAAEHHERIFRPFGTAPRAGGLSGDRDWAQHGAASGRAARGCSRCHLGGWRGEPLLDRVRNSIERAMTSVDTIMPVLERYWPVLAERPEAALAHPPR